MKFQTKPPYHLCLALITAVLIFMPIVQANPFVDFQKDADIVRLKHLRYYGELIEEYRSKMGEYPFMGEANVPLYVHIASPEQEQYVQGGPPYSHIRKTFGELVAVLEKGLGRELPEYYDPQKVPVGRPNFYIYMANQDAYFFAVHVYQAYPFSRRIAENYFKIEISNMPTQMNQANNPLELFTSKSFLLAENDELAKPGFFADRESETLHATKQ